MVENMSSTEPSSSTTTTSTICDSMVSPPTQVQESHKGINDDNDDSHNNKLSETKNSIDIEGEIAEDDPVEEKENKELKVTEEELDEEGLKRNGYDVILFGTGLTQSILASALTRAGKSILHCDGNDFYGEKDAVFSLGHLMEWSSSCITISTHNTDDIDIVFKKKEHEVNELNSKIACDDYIELNPKGALSSIRIHSETKAGTAQQVPKFEKGMSVVTPYGHGTILCLPHSNAPTCGDSDNFASKNTNPSLAVQLTNWIMADGKSPIVYLGDHDRDQNHIYHEYSDHCKNNTTTTNVIPKSMFQFQQYVLRQQRYYALDLTPGLLHANGDAVSGMIESGVSACCEFKSLLGLHLFIEPNSSKANKKRSASTGTNTPIDGDDLYQLSRVPCSKRDLFQTKLLSPVEKRKLMKFLQMASDYAFAKSSSIQMNNDKNDDDVPSNPTDNNKNASSSTIAATTTPITTEEDVVTSLNERQLQQGRSLYRPQNKIVSTSDLERLQQRIEEGMNFETYLEKEHKLPQRLRNIVIFALALGSTTGNDDGNQSYSTRDGMNDLSLHLQSLGRYGGTAFLVPLYGTGELSQAFCRSAAVHGGTYLLRRAIKKVLLDDDNGTYIRGVLLDQASFEDENEEGKQKEIPAQHVVVPSDSIAMKKDATSRSRVLRRISILSGKLPINVYAGNNVDSSSNEMRNIIIVPPGTIGNSNVIHGIVLDENTNVAPLYIGEDFSATVLHLTTVIEEEGIANDDEEDILHKTVQSLIKSQGECDVEEIYHLSFSFNSTNDVSGDTFPRGVIKGLHVCDRRGQSITVESAFREASTIFKKISYCDGSPFFIN